MSEEEFRDDVIDVLRKANNLILKEILLEESEEAYVITGRIHVLLRELEKNNVDLKRATE